jgi:multiple sugar transport system permease protein
VQPTQAPVATAPRPASQSWFRRRFTGRSGRRLREYLTGYLMILPATVLIFVFGIFPVGFALYVSVHQWKLRRGDFTGLSNYVRAIDNLIYVLLFALAVGALVLSWTLLRRIRRQAEEQEVKPWIMAFPAALHAAALIAFIRWTVLLLPQVLDIANKVIAVERTRELFVRLLGEAFSTPNVVSALLLFLLLLGIALLVSIGFARWWRKPGAFGYQVSFTTVWLALVTGIFLAGYTYQQAALAYQVTLDTGANPELWSQIITIGSGVLLLVAAWFVWRGAEGAQSHRKFWLRILGATGLLVGGWVLIGELPMVIAAGDKDVWEGLKVTIFYSLGTVPFQLAFSLFLAVLLFQRLAGSEVFRMLFFLPYVTPFIASAAVFKQMFSIRPQAPVNQFLQFIGLEPLRWIQEPNGIFKLLAEHFGRVIPTWAEGPSLALVVVIIFSIWVYVGYDTVIYLAGLGNISTELIEVAEIDGASRWQIFRHIIFPLLSPTTYFLSLIAIIGTFKAFSHIWVLRHELALGTVDTFSVTIFLEFYDKVRYGYASALAFILFAIILSLTVLNNRLQGSRVFYG